MTECAELVEYLYEIGPYEVGAMGLQPLSWTQIEAWQRTTGIRLDSWEAQQVRKLSFVYLDQHHKAEEPTCPCPWVDELHVDHQALGERIKQRFRQFNQSRRGMRRDH